MNSTYLWHLRLGHVNVDRINRLVKDGPLKFLKIESYPDLSILSTRKDDQKALS